MYVEITEDEFDQFMYQKGFVRDYDIRTYELIYFKFIKPKIFIRVYSTILSQEGRSRARGQDAIRVVLRIENKRNIYTLWSGPHVKRVENWRANLANRIDEALLQIHPLNCPKCGAFMVLRQGENGLFYGCSNYAKTKCRGTRE